jgi:hypothetical protein
MFFEALFIRWAALRRSARCCAKLRFAHAQLCAD